MSSWFSILDFSPREMGFKRGQVLCHYFAHVETEAPRGERTGQRFPREWQSVEKNPAVPDSSTSRSFS